MSDSEEAFSIFIKARFISSGTSAIYLSLEGFEIRNDQKMHLRMMNDGKPCLPLTLKESGV
jgi:hypothetical protein